ncbi:AI-2E family transporter [Clostridium perfringens]|uniref:AI-2E family transporter n=1 Tax=Clostridium perfringens TaxID=1502 RepID=A0AAW9I3J7_CLOPF|nr:AI-2E family transporter [Clostridium perfringens]MBI6026095.1 AI-2E family transporter [Clostridium perfringens]MBI6074433.1 AI-2E family transporter [Clostridium perfringens]MBI6090989.1 AI-2E family transporter [Clostridium perfringens]MBI6105121.1 AI-2E family transporter [Clostridium perfringens]MDK0812527.1 AI-2E family transporter [Clostridium perfringens]
MFFNDKKLKGALIVVTYAIILHFVFMKYSTVFGGLGYITGLVKPLILGIAIAFVLNIPMKFFERKLFRNLENSKKSWVRSAKRPLSIAVTIIVLIGTISAIILFVVPQLTSSVVKLTESIPTYLKSFEVNMNNYADSTVLLSKVWDQVMNTWQEILKTVTHLFGGIASYIVGLTVDVTTAIIDFCLAFVLAIYMLSSKEKLICQIKKVMYAYLRGDIADKILEIGQTTNRVFSGFIIGQCTEALIIGTLCFLGMLVLRMPYAFLISVLVGTTSLIPILGAFIGTIPSFFLIFIINPIKAFWFIVFIFCLQRVEGDLIYPRVVGGSVGLSSLWVMLAIMIGGSAFGFIGMLVGVPTAAVIYCVFGSVTNKRLSKKGIKIDEEEIEDSGKIHV